MKIDVDYGFVDDLVRGNASLWISESVNIKAFPIDLYAEFDWTAIWCESTDRRWADSIERFRKKEEQARYVIAVPGRLEGALGMEYSLSQYLPIFFLNGVADAVAKLPERETRRARDEKIDQIAALKKGTICILGIENPEDIVNLICEEFPMVNNGVKYVVPSAGADFNSDLAGLLGSKAPHLISSVGLLEGDFGELLERARSTAAQPDRSPSVLVETGSVDIQPFLNRESPIDQTFRIILSTDLTDVDDDLSNVDVLEQFLAGRGAPWRAYNRHLTWSREEASVTEVVKSLESKPTPASSVTVYSIAGEQGSGLTTILQKIAFRSAQRGYPTLIYRSQSESFQYDDLRSFLEGIQRTEKGSLRKALIVVDESEMSSVPMGIAELPYRLANDVRPVVILRGVRIRRGENFDGDFRETKKLASIVSAKVAELWYPNAIRDELDAEAQKSLSEWVAKNWGADAEESKTLNVALGNWGSGSDSRANYPDRPPFLVFLHLILKERLTTPAMMGRHLLKRIRRSIKSLQDDSTGKKLTPDQLVYAVELLRESFQSRSFNSEIDNFAATKPDVLEKTVIALSAFACLRVYPPLSVLADVVEFDAQDVGVAVDRLCADDFASRFGDASKNSASMNARHSFYTSEESVGLRHYVFGSLILDALEKESVEYCESFAEQVKASYDTTADFQMRLLTALLPTLSPRKANVEFVAHIARTLLRYQRVQGSAYHEWLYETDQRENLVRTLAAIPAVIVSQSASILHTVGLTRYKCITYAPGQNQEGDVEKNRAEFRVAAEFLELAQQRVDESYDDSDDSSSIKTTNGNLHKRWATMEKAYGYNDEAVDLRDRAVELYQSSLHVRTNNSHAAGSLADILLDNCDEIIRSGTATDQQKFARDLSMAFEYLQYKPNPLFIREWENNVQRAVSICETSAADDAIASLISNQHDLGNALAAMKVLRGVIPEQVSEESGQIRINREAASILEVNGSAEFTRSHLADLIRYAVYSALPENKDSDSFADRHELIRKLDPTHLLGSPVFLYDYAMLSYQVGDYEKGNEIYQELRRGRKFLDVPLDRARFLFDPSNPSVRLTVNLQVTELNNEKYCWAKIVSGNFGEGEPQRQSHSAPVMHVPFTLRDFRNVVTKIKLGTTLPAFLRLRSAGPTAVPTSTSV